jgi:D-lactate dehydrogenase (cytochrome)
MLSTSSRLRIISNRLFSTSLKSISTNSLKKSALPALNNRIIQTREYATKDNKQVSYTVDKFPGYVRNENYKKVYIFSM